MSKREVVVLSGVRTAIADFGGTLKDQPASELAAKVVAEAVNRSGLSPEDIGHCVIGSVLHGDRRDMYISRVAALKAGLPIETPSLNCKSTMRIRSSSISFSSSNDIIR